MPLFGWTRRPRRGPRRPTRRPGPGGPAGTLLRELLRELQRHLEERERALRETDSGPEEERPGVDGRWPRNYQGPHASIPTAERRRLEALCSRVQPHQTGPILGR